MGRHIPTNWIQPHVRGSHLSDPILTSHNITAFVRYAEMDPTIKNQLSHRYKALNMLVGYLKHTTI
jgi:Ham1 family